MRSQREKPAPGQESVWDYPRPPRVEPTDKLIQVQFNAIELAESRRALRVLETSHPPVYYIPPSDIRMQPLEQNSRTTFCEYKGLARYYDVMVGALRVVSAAWSYPEPTPGYESLADHVAFYPALMDACLVDGEQVVAQEGDFYGGWLTGDIVGPIKGAPHTRGW